VSFGAPGLVLVNECKGLITAVTKGEVEHFSKCHDHMAFTVGVL
jgi:hypothetical protein